MTSHLTPTQVADKNGRLTTVHKRLDAAQSASKMSNVPAPAIASQTDASDAPRTPIVMPEPLTTEQREAYMAWQNRELHLNKYRPEVVKSYRQPFDPAVQALAWRIVQNGSVPEKTVDRFLGAYHPKRVSQLARMFGHKQDELLDTLRSRLLVAEKIGLDHPEIAHYVHPGVWAVLEMAVDGYCYSPKRENRVQRSIDTEEELASVAAVTTYLLEARRREDYGSYRDGEFQDAEGNPVKGTYILNRTLDAYLRKNPHEIDRVLAYVNERGMGNTVKDTKALIKHLEGSAELGVLENGWL